MQIYEKKINLQIVIIFINEYFSMKKNFPVNQIDFSLTLIERVANYNLSLYESVEEKIEFLESYYRNIMNQVFYKQNYIIETFNYKFINNLILESDTDLKKKIHDIHFFIKHALKFDYITEQNNQAQKTPQVNNKKQKSNDLFQDAPSFNTMQVQGGYQNSTAQSYSSTVVLNKIGWDKFFNTLRDGLDSAIYSVAQNVASFLFPTVGAGIKIAGTIGWGVLLIWDLYKNNTGLAVIDFFLAACQFIPGILGGQTKKLVSLGKKWAAAGVESLDTLVTEVLESLGMKEKLAGVIASILSVVENLLKSIRSAADWIIQQLGSSAEFFRTWVQKAVDFVGGIKSSLQKYAQSIKVIPNTKPTSYVEKIQAGQAIRQDSVKPALNVNKMKTKL